MPTSLSRLTECISDFVISSGKEGASVSDVLSQFSSEPPRACRYIIEGLIRKGYRVCRPAGNETLGHAENIFESNSSLRIAAPRSLYYKSVGIVSHEDLQGDDFEKVLDIVAASREIGSLAMELGKGQGLARVERLVLVGLLRKRIVYPPVEGASTTLRAGVLHLQRFAGQFHPSVAGSSLEPDDNARAALVDCIHYVLERCHLSRINIFRLGSLFDLSPATIRSLRPMCGPCCKLQVSDDSRGNTFIDLNSGAVSRPVRESRGGGILSLSLFEQLLPAISNLSSVGLTVNEFCYQTGLGKKEAQSRFDNLIGMYTLSHSVDQSGTVHSQMRIIPDSRNVIASGGLIPSQSADKGAANVHIFKSEAHRNIPISDVDAIKAPVITLHEQRYDAVWNCIITNGGVCSLHDCFNAVREMYTRRGIAFVVDRKTVNRIIEQLSENGNIILHTVSETQALENLKTGAKLIIRRCDGVPLFSLDEAFAIYSSRRPSSDLEKRQFDAELVVIEAAESFGTETIPALNEYFPDIELVSKYRFANSVKRDKIDKGVDSRDNCSLISFLMGMNTEGRVCILRYLHESFCSFNDSKTLCSENSSSDSINMPFYSLVQFVQFISFRLLVKCFWVPTVLAFELVKFATRSNLKMLRESSLEHSFVQCMKNKEANLESFLVMLSAGSGENLKALVLKYYCTHVAAAMSLLIDLGLITAHIFPVPNSESAEDMDLLNSCQYSFVRKPTIALNPIESPQDCGMFWRHILVPQLKEHESFRNEGVVKSDQLIRSTDPMISFSIRQLSADDFLRSNYDSTRRKRTIADFSEMASRRIYNYEVSAHDTKKKIKYGSYHKKPKIKLNGDSHVSSLIDSAMVDQVWSLDEDAFLIELYLDGLLIQSAASLPKGIRQKMMSRYREEIRTSDSLASAQATGVLPSLVRFNAVTKEFSSSNSELSACTYPAQSLLETNYEYLQVEGGRLLSTGKSLLQSQKIMTSGNYRLELLLKNIRYFRAAISYLLATKCTGHNQCNIYGDGIAEDLLDVINDVLDPLRLKESRNLCADILDEAAMTRCLQLMTAPVRKYSGDEPPLYPDSISALTLFEEDVYSRVVWELCNARLLQQAPSATISDKELNLRLFEKTEFPPRSFKMHRCVSYRKLLASYIKIAGAENAKTVLGKRATFADGLVEPKAKHRKINGIEALSTYPIDLTSASISAAEALVLIQNISQGYFCGNLNVMSDKSDKDVFDKEINSAENGSCITTTFSLHPSQPYVGDLHFLKKASSPSFVTMGKALSNIEIEIDTKYIGFELDRVTYDELVVGRDDFFTHADSTQIDSNVSAEVINIIKSFKNRGQSMLALLNQVQSAYPSSELIHEQILVSIVLKHFSSGIIFLYQRSVNFLSELELRFIPELEEYGQKTIEYFETLLLEPKHMRQQFYENVYLIHSDYRKFYYSSSSIESRCPWINADGRRDQDRFGDLITCVVSCLSSNPGSPIEIIQSVLPFVTLLQTAVLVGILVSDGIVEFKEVQVLRNAPSDPFQNEMSTQGLGVRTITLYYLPCHKVPCW